MPVKPPDEAMLARMPMPRDEYERLRPRSRWTLVKQKLLNIIAHSMIHPGIRLWLYRQMGIQIAKGCIIELFSYMDDQFPELIVLKEYSGISRYCKTICHDDATARTDPTNPTRHGIVAPIILEPFAAVGAGSILLPGVTIHASSVVAAGAVVTKSVPPYSLVGGVPARVIKTYPQPGESAEKSTGEINAVPVMERSQE